MRQHLNEEWFQRLRRNADEVLKIQRNAEALFREQPPERFDGLGHLLGKVVPPDPQRLGKVAEALGVGDDVFARLRASELDPIHVPLPVLATLGQLLGLEEDVFLDLVLRDHTRFGHVQVRSRSPATEGVDFEAGLRGAWTRAELDNPEEI